MSQTNENTDKICKSFIKLVNIIETLRSPGGCPWDIKQNHKSMKKYVLDEAEEVVEAIEKNDILNLQEELGDLLMIIIFHAQIAKEAGNFTITEVCNNICEKLINRHPHVFNKKTNEITSDEVIKQWGEIKKDEKENNNKVSNKMKQMINFNSALISAQSIQEEAAKVGFDFTDIESAFAKITEEAQEVKELLMTQNKNKLAEEIGDLLFATINVARLAGFNSKDLLQKASKKFINRFEYVEQQAIKDGGFKEKSIEELDKYWNKIKTL